MKDSEELIKDLKHKDSSVRRHAVEMLGIIGDEKTSLWIKWGDVVPIFPSLL